MTSAVLISVRKACCACWLCACMRSHARVFPYPFFLEISRHPQKDLLCALLLCVWGGLAAGQIYDSNQSSSSLMKCLDGAFCKMGSRGSSPMTTIPHVKAPGLCVDVCVQAGYGRPVWVCGA